MKCYKHNDTDIVVQCHECSRGLCNECSNMFERIICETCAFKGNEEYKKGLVRDLATMALIFISSIAFCISQVGLKEITLPILQFILLASYFMASIPVGWSSLNRITPQVFLILPLIGWFFYFFIKLYAATFVGGFVAPFKIYRSAKELRAIKESQQIIGINLQ